LQVVKSEARADDGKRGVCKRQSIDFALPPTYVLEALFLLSFMCLLQHGWRHVETCGLPGHASEGAGKQAGTASHIQDRVIWAASGPLHNTVQRLFVADGRCSGKRRGLAGETGQGCDRDERTCPYLNGTSL